MLGPHVFSASSARLRYPAVFSALSSLSLCLLGVKPSSSGGHVEEDLQQTAEPSIRYRLRDGFNISSQRTVLINTL